MTERLWLAGLAGDWRNPANWSPVGVPQPGDRLVVVEGAPTIDGGAIRSETIFLLGSVALTAISVDFEPGPSGITRIIVSGGTGGDPTRASLLVEGETTLLSSIYVETIGGGLTIDADATFTIAYGGFLLVSQESFLSFTGDTIVHDGLLSIAGAATIGEDVAFLGHGMVQVDAGGLLDIDGTFGDHEIAFLGGSAEVTIADIDTFQGSLRFAGLGGVSVVIEDVRAKSASLDGDALLLYAGKKQKGGVVAELSVGTANPAGLAPSGVKARDFDLKGDGEGGTVITYDPAGPTMLQASLPVPVVAPLGAEVSLKAIFKSAFGTRHPDFHGLTLLPAVAADLSDPSQGFWGQEAVNGIPGVESGWMVNGKLITRPTEIGKGDTVSFLAGNSIGFPPQIQAQVTPKAKGGKAEYVTYDVWSVDPAVAGLVAATPGSPTTDDILASAAAFQAVYGTPFNSNLCNWIADNVAAAAGAPMPLPDANLDPAANVAGGFWRVAYRGSDTDSPAVDWNTLVEPGDIVRLEWARAGTGHTTTVLAVNGDGSLTVYDNEDKDAAGHNVIGAHGDVAYWSETNPAGITIYRLDPDQQYRIDGTSLGEFIQGSIFDDLIRARPGRDKVKGSVGDDEIHGGRGRDTIFGQHGDDVLVGGYRHDRLKGGEGDDVFAYASVRQSKPEGPDRDVIADFHHGDRIDLAAINLKLEAKGKVPFHFVGEAPFTGTAGELVTRKKAAKTLIVEGDRDGDGVADFAIKVHGVAELTEADFIL